MGKENIKTPEYRKKQQYANLSDLERINKETDDLITQSLRSRAILDEMNEDFIRRSFNCPGFRGGGFSADPLRNKGEYLESYYRPYTDYKGRTIVRLQVLNR